mgnify:CR=1 FL=1
MKYKLIDYTTETQEDVTLGTCDLCMSTGHTIDFPYFHIQDETGEVHEVPGFMWSWGDLFDIYIENIPHFAAWLENQDIQEPNYRDYDYSWLQTVVYKYDEQLDELDDLLPWLEEHAVVEDNTIRLPFDDKSKYYLMNYSMEQVLKMLGFHVGIIMDDQKVYHAVANNTVSFTDDIAYTDCDWNVKYDAIELWFSQYDEEGNHKEYQDIPLSDVFGELIIVLHGDNVPDVVFEKM